MRTIKFRAKSLESGEWVSGDLIRTPAHPSVKVSIIQDNVVIPVEESTIGEFTGLSDHKGRDVYEGDLVRIPETAFNAEIIGDVRYVRDGFHVVSRRSGASYGLDYVLSTSRHNDGLQFGEVIGDIHQES